MNLHRVLAGAALLALVLTAVPGCGRCCRPFSGGAVSNAPPCCPPPCAGPGAAPGVQAFSGGPPVLQNHGP